MKFGVFTNIFKDPQLEQTRNIVKILERSGQEFCICGDAANILPEISCADNENIDVIIVLGGDGTMLSAAGKYAGTAELLGINLGRIGFLMDADINEAEAAINRVISGDYFIEERMMITAEACGRHVSALNEIAVSQSVVQKPVTLGVYVNDMFYDDLFCNGVLVTTPTGSTAYSLSAGGPVILPTLDVLLINPVCPHSLRNQKVVIGADDIVRIEAKSEHIVVSADAYSTFELAPSDSVIIKKAELKAQLIRLERTNFYALLTEKLAEWNK